MTNNREKTNENI